MHRLWKMLMLLSVHMTSFLFLVRFNNFTLTIGLHALTLSRPFLCALGLSHIHHCHMMKDPRPPYFSLLLLCTITHEHKYMDMCI